MNPVVEATALPFAISKVLASADRTTENEALGVLSGLLKYGPWPTPKQLSLLGSVAGFEASSKCLLDAMCSAKNPLLVGMILSLRLAEAAGLGKEGQRRLAARLQQQVEDLVLEVFERLPQTVDGLETGDKFHGGMKASV